MFFFGAKKRKRTQEIVIGDYFVFRYFFSFPILTVKFILFFENKFDCPDSSEIGIFFLV